MCAYVEPGAGALGVLDTELEAEFDALAETEDGPELWEPLEELEALVGMLDTEVGTELDAELETETEAELATEDDEATEDESEPPSGGEGTASRAAPGMYACCFNGQHIS